MFPTRATISCLAALFCAAISLLTPRVRSAASECENPVYSSSGTIGGFNGLHTRAIAIDSSGDVLVADGFYGAFDFDPTDGVDIRNSLPGADLFLTRIHPDGSYGGTCTIGGAEGSAIVTAIALDTEGNIYLAGKFWDTVDFDLEGPDEPRVSNGDADAFLTRLSPSCQHLWTRTWGGIRYEELWGLGVASNGDVVVSGQFGDEVDFDPSEVEDIHYTSGNPDAFVSKYDGRGGYLWTRAFTGFGREYAEDLAIDGDGNIIVTGSFTYNTDFNPTDGIDIHIPLGVYEIYVTKLDADGGYRWTRTMGGASTSYGDWGKGVAVDSQGDVFVTGSFEGPADLDPTDSVDWHIGSGEFDVFVTKLSPDGDFEWTRTVGGTTQDTGSDIAVDALGNVAVIGQFYGTVDFDPSVGTDVHSATTASYSDIFVTRLRSEGSYIWTGTVGGCGDDYAGGITTTPFSDLIYTGSFCWLVDFDDPCPVHPCSADLDPTNAGIDEHASNIDNGLIGSGDLFVTTQICTESTADADADGDVDLEDFASFESCFLQFAVTAECRALDLIPTLLIDLPDLAAMSAISPGPNVRTRTQDFDVYANTIRFPARVAKNSLQHYKLTSGLFVGIS